MNVTSAMLTPGDRTFATYCKPTAITDELLERVYTMSKGAKLVQMQEAFCRYIASCTRKAPF